MNTGQMMLTLGAMLLLSFLTLRVNNSQLSTQDVMQTSKFGILAISLASSLIEEANHKFYDEATVGEFIDVASKMTIPGNLGKDTGEFWPDSIDDFDDYNGYSYVDSTMPSAVFNMACAVNYVLPSNPDSVVNTQTFHKRLLITVTSKAMSDTIRLSTIFSYWKFP